MELDTSTMRSHANSYEYCSHQTVKRARYGTIVCRVCVLLRDETRHPTRPTTTAPASSVLGFISLYQYGGWYVHPVVLYSTGGCLNFNSIISDFMLNADAFELLYNTYAASIKSGVTNVTYSKG